MGKTLNPKSLRVRRLNVLIYGHQSNQASNLGSVLGRGGIRLSGSGTQQLRHTISMVRPDRRLRWTNSRRPGFFSRHQTFRSLISTRRVLGSSHSWLQGRQSYIYLTSSNMNIRTGHRFTGPTLQDNQKSISKLLKEGKDTKPLGTFNELKSMATPSSSTQIASSSQLNIEKDTRPLAHQLSCANSTEPVGPQHLTEEQQFMMFNIMKALKEIVLCFMFYFWLRNFRPQ